MKKVFFLFVLVVLCFYTNITKAQIGLGTTAPNSTAVLELQSDVLGFLPPRMTTAQRNLINSPAQGLVIFNTGTKCLEWYTGSAWISLCNNAVGTITCANSSIRGGYNISTALTDSNYLRLEVVVSQLGAWNITTNIENGCWFQGSGVFTSTGTQIIRLLGRGTPSTYGSFVYIAIFGASYCSFNVNLACSDLTVSDVDGNSYNTVGIGTQCWMKQNLKTSKYNDNTAIPNVSADAMWAALTTGAFCDYDNTPSNSVTYGKLYNWFAVDNNAATKVASNGGRNVCPTGWHIPSDADWCKLSTYLDASANCGINGDESSIAGGKLRETGSTHWPYPNTGATNETGFTALPGGYRYSNGFWYYIGSMGYWWSSTEYDASSAWSRYLGYTPGGVRRSANVKKGALSVRCVKD